MSNMKSTKAQKNISKKIKKQKFDKKHYLWCLLNWNGVYDAYGRHSIRDLILNIEALYINDVMTQRQAIATVRKLRKMILKNKFALEVYNDNHLILYMKEEIKENNYIKNNNITEFDLVFLDITRQQLYQYY